MSDPNVHVANHPTGQPNKTAVNPDNPIFGRPADPIPAVSLQQAAVVQSEKNPRETVISPLLNEPTAADLDAIAAENAAKEATSQAEEAGSGSERNGSKADDWTKTKGEGLTADTSSADTGAEYTHSSGEGSSKITPVVPVKLPTQEEADAIVAQAQAEMATRGTETKIYTDGTTATGVAPLPDLSPAQQDAEGELNDADNHPTVPADYEPATEHPEEDATASQG